MKTLTFKVSEAEARSLRMAAHRAQLTLSEYLRQRIRANTEAEASVHLVKCPATGAMIFAPDPLKPPLTPAVVKKILTDFP
jgi:hypothetical protein